MSLKEKVLFAGYGGQGVLAAGKIFADACVENGLDVSWLPSYGPEMRGGTCNCQVVISDMKILSPIFTRPTCLVIMNQASFDRFSTRLQNTKLVIVNSSLVEVPEKLKKEHPETKFIQVAATDMAQKLGSIRSANMTMLGALARHIHVLKLEDLKTNIQKIFAKKPGVLEVNISALDEGYRIEA